MLRGDFITKQLFLFLLVCGGAKVWTREIREECYEKEKMGKELN